MGMKIYRIVQIILGLLIYMWCFLLFNLNLAKLNPTVGLSYFNTILWILVSLFLLQSYKIYKNSNSLRAFYIFGVILLSGSGVVSYSISFLI